MVVFDKYLYIDIDYQLKNQDKYIGNLMDLYLVFVDMWLNNYTVNLNMRLMYLKKTTQEWNLV
jgi:hypothetical protein